MKHKIGFTRAKTQEVYVSLKIKKSEGYKGDEAVKRAIINYIGGIDSDGITYSGLKLGDDVIISKVIGSVMCLGGVADVEVSLSTDDKTYQDTSLDIDKYSIARVEPNRIEITYV